MKQQAIFQSLVDEAYLQFVEIVADGRGMTVEEAAELADGRIYTAKQALDVGLIDSIGTLEDAITDMQDTYDLWDCSVVEMTPEDTSFFSFLSGLSQPAEKDANGDVAALLEMMERSGEFPISYTCKMLNQ